MKIRFRDFAPDWKQKVLGLAIGGRQTMDTVLEATNAWIAREQVDVLSIETLILPQSAAEQSSTSAHDDVRYNIGMFELTAQRVQVVRVWYRSAA